MAMLYYTQYPAYNNDYPVDINEWSPILPVYPIYTYQPVLVSAVLTPPTYIYSPSNTPILHSPITSSNTSLYGSVDYEYDDAETEDTWEEDPIDYYLSLPKDLFPNARMLAIDPNWVIDACLKTPDLHRHIPWLLDLEFGIPRSPVTRILPYYNVKYNSVHCKNNPEAVHPGFESCTQEFKKVLLFYLDCIASAWYKGYGLYNSDWSVENFQSWLLLPMQRYGMCWPLFLKGNSYGIRTYRESYPITACK